LKQKIPIFKNKIKEDTAKNLSIEIIFKKKKMNPENDSFKKMDEPMKRKKIFGKLFEELENNKIESTGSSFENLPKLVLSQIILELDIKDVAKLFCLNKFFFKFLWFSSNSSQKKTFLLFQKKNL
jgi:hypothetical protein